MPTTNTDLPTPDLHSSEADGRNHTRGPGWAEPSNGIGIWVKPFLLAVAICALYGTAEQIGLAHLGTWTFHAAVVGLAASIAAIVFARGQTRIPRQTRGHSAEYQRVEADRIGLAGAIEQTSDAIVITDTAGNIQSVNPAFTTLTGYSAREVIGKKPRVLQSGRQGQSFYRDLWDTILTGKIWHGELVNRRKDGTLYVEEMTITPVRDPGGVISKFIAIKLDATARRETQEAQALLASIVESSEDAIFSSALDGTVLTWNKAAESIWAYRAEEVIGRPVSILAGPDHYREQAQVLDRIRRGQSSQIETLSVKADGSLLETALTVSPVRNPAGEVVASSTIARDISGRERAGEALRQSEEKYRSLVTNIPDVIWTADSRGDPIFASPSCEGICGYTPEEICRHGAWRALIHPEDVPRYQAAIHTMQAAYDVQSEKAQRYDQQYRIRRKDGQWIWVHSRGTGTYEKHGERYVDGLLSDITERKQLEQSLAHQVTHDTLTGLPNRQVFDECFQQALALARHQDGKLALLYLDLDRFKAINDTLGHLAADDLLHQTAQRLSGCLRESEMLARSRGDEFMLMLTGVDDPQIAPGIAERMLGSLSAPFHVGGNEVFLSATIGIAFYPQDGQDLLSLQRNAEAAVLAAKHQGRNRFQMFTAAMGIAAGRRRAVETELHRALERREFSLHFQPKIDLATGAIAGVEALLRWDTPKLGTVSPSEFIPIAEETGLIMPISKWVLWEACRQERAWREAGCEPVQIAVNVSAVQLTGGNLPGMVARALAETGMDASCLDLEVTESAIMCDVKDSARQLAELKQLGVSISLDDFGTGYSSLSHLVRFPIDTLKIDQSFVRRIDNADIATLISAIVALAHGLGMRTIAEGVESERDLESLKTMGCDLAQGFLLGQPMPPDFIAQMLVMQPPRFVPAGGAGRPGHVRSNWGSRLADAEPGIKALVN